ncbi:MAG: hypothetical protein CMH54_05615 [Myxococcales bacterium]|nr:hypothetical protein [Myxococcales bacterium]
MFGLNRFLICFLFISILVSGLWGCAEDSAPVTCEHAGNTYNAGDSFPAGDDCNSCSCTDSGEVACTLMACPTTCEYDGETYFAGDSFPATDGCNTCGCQNDGTVSCTEEACAECPPPVVTDEPCDEVIAHAKDPETGLCCEYGTPCQAPEGWLVFYTEEDCAKGCSGEDCPTTCDYNGQTYNEGDSFPATDGCNSCVCDADGSVGCTEIDCPTTCDYEGTNYDAGETWDASDGCNSCTCNDDGTIDCTEEVCSECPPPVTFEGPCEDVVAYAKHPETGLCCEYGTPCEVSEGWLVFYTEEECTKGCSGDDCPVTCEYEGATYNAGESWDASDGCNTCTCHEDGMIACTLMLCPEGCTSSAQCGAEEVCDFEYDNCGMWGQTGTCIPRPQICPAGGVGACGCDGTPALNSCELQGQGTDALQFGGCHLQGSDLVRCGEIDCDPTTHYCSIAINDIAGPDQPEYYNTCNPIPESCAGSEPVDCGCMEIGEMVECYDKAKIVIMVYPGG